jgi:hypothetical protein
MTEEQPRLYSKTTMIGALGALLIIAAAFFPLLSVSNPQEGHGIKWLSDYREELQAFRQNASQEGAPQEAKIILSIVNPSLDRLDAFLVHPTGYKLWFILQDAHRFCGVALDAQQGLKISNDGIQVLKLAQISLAFVLIFLSTIPIFGGYHIVRGVLLRFRKLRTPALVLTFFLGLSYMLVSGLPLFGLLPEERAFVGVAPYLLFAGASLLVFCSIFGVSKHTWWKAYLLYILGLSGIAYVLVRTFGNLHS